MAKPAAPRARRRAAVTRPPRTWWTQPIKSISPSARNWYWNIWTWPPSAASPTAVANPAKLSTEGRATRRQSARALQGIHAYTEMKVGNSSQTMANPAKAKPIAATTAAGMWRRMPPNRARRYIPVAPIQTCNSSRLVVATSTEVIP